MRILRQRASQKDALTLAAGEFLNRTARKPEEVEAFERGVRDLKVVAGLEMKWPRCGARPISTISSTEKRKATRFSCATIASRRAIARRS